MGPSFGGRSASAVLDFDVEARPIAWYGGDFVTKQPTAIAWKFTDAPKEEPYVAVIGLSDRSSKVLDEEISMLEEFRMFYDMADIVTGHFIRGFDLPVLNAAMIRLGLPPLEQKWTVDTKLDFIKASGISKSQENLGAMFELNHPKVPMNTARWADANMLLPEGIEATRTRVVGDVKQHIELLATMRERGLIGPGKLWTPGAGNGKTYSP